MLGQVGQNQELHTVLLDNLVMREVPPGNMGIDRYLSRGACSRRKADQINRCPAAFLLNMGFCFFAKGYAHQFTAKHVP